jgi:selenocysteine lyase/cysteine desulfurase
MLAEHPAEHPDEHPAEDPADRLARWRADTPGCERVVHLNHAGSSLPPSVVTETVVDHVRREAEVGGYEAAAEAAPRLAAVYGSLARLIGARDDEIALVENATRAWDMAFYGLALDLAPGDTVITGVNEYASNYLAFLHARRTRGIEIVVAPDDATGALDVEALDRLVDGRTRLIAITHVPTNGGLVNPAEAVGAVARRHGVPYLLDACQSVGQLPIDVEAIGCDFLSATGRKFLRGPRGTGFLYARRETTAGVHPPMVDLHAADWVGDGEYRLRPDARRFENWERNIAGVLGLGAAVDYALGVGLPLIGSRVRALAAELRERLADVPGVTVRDKGERPCGIVTFDLDGVPADTVRDRLRAAGINTSVTTATSTRLDFEQRGLPDLVRASVHYLTTAAELQRLADGVAAVGATGGTT